MIKILTVLQSLLLDRRLVMIKIFLRAANTVQHVSKAFYEKDIEANHTLKRQRYVMLCAILYFVWDEL